MESGETQILKEPSLAERERAALIGPGHSFATITDKIASIVLHEPSPIAWWLALAVGLALLGGLGTAVGYLLFKGVGIWGINMSGMIRSTRR